MNKSDKIFRYNIVYFCSIVGSIICMFFPWRIEYAYVYPGVEIVYLIPLFTITICFILSSSVLNFVFYLYESNKVVYIVGFALGITGTVLGTVSGFFGIYYSYVGFRVRGVFLLGSATYWIWIILILLFCVLLLVNNRRGISQTIPITDL